MQCPKCGYLRQSSDHAPDWQCPACKVAYAKVKAAANTPPQTPASSAPPSEAEITDEDWQYERQHTAASGQKIVIYCIILNFVLRSAEQSLPPAPLVIGLAFFAVSLWSVWGILNICSGLERSQNQKILFMVLSFMPLINILVMIYLSAKTNKMLKQAGWKIGLLGAKP